MVGWFICRYNHRFNPFKWPNHYSARIAMDEHTVEIAEHGGAWGGIQAFGGFAVCKVVATPAVLNAIAALDGFWRIPLDRLDDPLSTLPSKYLTQINQLLQSMGFTVQEIEDKFGVDWENVLIRTVLRFMISRWRQWRWNADLERLEWDGTIHLKTDEQTQIELQGLDLEISE